MQENHPLISIYKVQVPHDEEQRKHGGLQRYHETNDKIPAYKLCDLIFPSGHCVCSHRAEDDDQDYRTHRNQKRIAKVSPEIHRPESLAVIVQRKGRRKTKR